MVTLWCAIAAWVWIHRWSQRNRKGPKTWPIVGAAIEQLMNYDRMHDWLVEYLSKCKTITVKMPFTSYTYIADPASVEHVLKTNFANYPKVGKLLYLSFRDCISSILFHWVGFNIYGVQEIRS